MASLKTSIATAALILSGVTPASAMDISSTIPLPEASQVLGWYGNLSTGRDQLSDFSVCLDPAARCSAHGPALDSGLIFEASVGYGFRSGFRLEGELSQRRDSLDDLRDADSGLNRGVANQLALMLNGAYDFDTQTPLTPYIGAGLGGVHIGYDDPGLLGESLEMSEDSSWKLGFQGFAGLQYEFSPDLKIGVRYTAKLVNKTGNTSSFDSGVDGGNAGEDSLRSRALMLTLTFDF